MFLTLKLKEVCLQSFSNYDKTNEPDKKEACKLHMPKKESYESKKSVGIQRIDKRNAQVINI